MNPTDTIESLRAEPVCECGHPKSGHFNGRGMCECMGLRGHTSVCACRRFKKDKQAFSRTSEEGKGITSEKLEQAMDESLKQVSARNRPYLKELGLTGEQP